MHYKLAEQSSLIQAKKEIKESDLLKESLKNEYELLNLFLNKNDDSVRIIHKNQEMIKSDIDTIFKQSEILCKISKEACKSYDEFIEYMKDAGDLFNYSEILSEEINKLNERVNSL